MKIEVETAAILKGVAEVFAPTQKFRVTISSHGTVTLEDGKRYLRVVGTTGGPITRSEATFGYSYLLALILTFFKSRYVQSI